MAIPSIPGTQPGGQAASGAFTVPNVAGAGGQIAFASWYGTAVTDVVAPTGWVLWQRGNTHGGDNYTFWGVWTSDTGTPGTSWSKVAAAGAVSVTILGLSGPPTIRAESAGTDVSDEGTSNPVNSPTINTGEAALVISAVLANIFGSAPTLDYPTALTLGRGQSVVTGSGEFWATGVAAAEQATPGPTGTFAWDQGASWWYPRTLTLAVTVPEAAAANEGSASGTVSWAGTAQGQSQPGGSATGAIEWVGAAFGARMSEGSAAGTVSWAGTAMGPFTAAFGKYLSANRRYLVDQDGQPWAMRMTSPWGWVAHYDLAEWTNYFENIASKGFNACLFEVIATLDGGGGVNEDGRNYNGDLPFVGGDITVLNAAYWNHIVDIVAVANLNGITPVLSIMDGWALDPIFTGTTEADCLAYGDAVATLMNGKHVLWHLGGDYDPVTNEPWDGAPHDLRMRACMWGVRDAGHDEALTVQLNYDYSFTQQNQFWEAEVGGDLGDGWSFVYTYYATYAAVFAAYNWTTQANQWPGDRNPRPAMFSEANYWGENVGGGGLGMNTTAETIRRQVGWAITFGSPGFGYGDDNWDGSRGAVESLLNDSPPNQVNRLADRVFDRPAWTDLVPEPDLVTAGAGTYRVGAVAEDVLANDYATSARTPDGALAFVYVPTDATASERSITLDTTLLGSNPVATWYDPVTEATQDAGAGPTYTVPAAHADGTRDYLLEITADPPTAEGSASGTVGWAGSAVGTTTRRGAAAGSVAWAGSAVGTAARSGAAAGTVSWAGAAAGGRDSLGTAQGTVSWAGFASAGNDSFGIASGTVGWAGSATGERMSLGTAAGGMLYAGTAAGLRESQGSAAGTHTWGGAASGSEGIVLPTNQDWPMQWTVPDGADPAKVALAEQYAAATMRMLTLYRVGGPLVAVHPHATTCHHQHYVWVPQYGGYGYVCGCRAECSCPHGSTVLLHPPVGRVEEVTVDGVALDPAVYRVEDGAMLVRTDGGLWPGCPDSGFKVTYLNGYPVDDMGSHAGGVLADEFYRALTGDRGCRLPANVTSIVRQGVSMQVTRGMFPENSTGITEVDTFIRMWNPHGMVSAPGVYSPDLTPRRQTTWRA